MNVMGPPGLILKQFASNRTRSLHFVSFVALSRPGIVSENKMNVMGPPGLEPGINASLIPCGNVRALSSVVSNRDSH